VPASSDEQGDTMCKLNSHCALVAAAAAAPTADFAHTGLGDAHDLLHGFMHPIGGPDHVLAMVAVGMIAAQLGGRALWTIPTSFVAVMAVAGACAMAGIRLPYVEIGIAFSVIALGAVVALPVKLSLAIVAAMVAVFAVFHGYSHGLEVGDGSGIAFGFGFASATALLHLAGIGLSRALDHAGVPRGRRIARAGGGTFAVAGVAMLASNLMS